MCAWPVFFNCPTTPLCGSPVTVVIQNRSQITNPTMTRSRAAASATCTSASLSARGIGKRVGVDRLAFGSSGGTRLQSQQIRGSRCTDGSVTTVLALECRNVSTMDGGPPELCIRTLSRNQRQVLVYAIAMTGVMAFVVVLVIQNRSHLFVGSELVTVLAVLVWAFLLYCAYLSLRPLRVTSTEIIIPSGFSESRVPVADVNWVLMLFIDFPWGSTELSGWQPFVGRSDGSVVCLGSIDYIPKRWFKKGDPAGQAKRLVTRGHKDAIRSTDPQLLARSAAGRLVDDVRTRVLALQGPDGPLAGGRIPIHPVPPDGVSGSFVAYWSPGGGIGPIGQH